LLGATLSFVGVLPPTWPHANLVDIIGDADADRYGRALEVLLGAAEADAILVMNCATAPTSNTRIAEAVLELMQQHRAPERRLKAVFVAWLGDAASQEARVRFANAIASLLPPPRRSMVSCSLYGMGGRNTSGRGRQRRCLEFDAAPGGTTGWRCSWRRPIPRRL
jgi:acyl-CoA synthetase (NDP forming)